MITFYFVEYIVEKFVLFIEDPSIQICVFSFPGNTTSCIKPLSVDRGRGGEFLPMLMIVNVVTRCPLYAFMGVS